MVITDRHLPLFEGLLRVRTGRARPGALPIIDPIIKISCGCIDAAAGLLSAGTITGQTTNASLTITPS